MNTLGKEPAFPTMEEDCISGVMVMNTVNGMSKRFYAACAAMQGLLSNRGAYYQPNSRNGPSEYCVKIAYEFADELLKQENL